jgi:hypothetical protein
MCSHIAKDLVLERDCGKEILRSSGEEEGR